MVPFPMILSDLWPTFQGHDNIQRQITRLIASRDTQWFCFHLQWPCVTLNLDFNLDAFDVLCTQLTRDLFAIAKFLLKIKSYNCSEDRISCRPSGLYVYFFIKPPSQSGYIFMFVCLFVVCLFVCRQRVLMPGGGLSRRHWLVSFALSDAP